MCQIKTNDASNTYWGVDDLIGYTSIWLEATQNDDILVAGGGDDVLLASLGADSIDGGGGTDTISYVDFRTTLLPDQFTLPALWLGLLAAATASLYVSPVQAIWGAALCYLSLWSVYWLFKLVTGKEGMGFGDFKLLAALGAFVGPQGLIPIVLMSSLVGAVIGTAILIAKGRDRQTPIPFGPFLAIAGWLQFLYGDWIIATYKHAMGFY